MPIYADVDLASGRAEQVVSYSEIPDKDVLALLTARGRVLVVIDPGTASRLQTRPHRRTDGLFTETTQ